MEKLKINQKQISKEDLQRLRDIQFAIQKILQNIGMLRYDYRISEIKFLQQLATSERSQENVSNKYGKGTVNLTTGVFTNDEREEFKMPKLKKLKKLKEVN